MNIALPAAYFIRKKRIALKTFIGIIHITVISVLLLTSPDHALAQGDPDHNKLPFKELIFALNESEDSHAPSIIELPDGDLFAVWYAKVLGTGTTGIWGGRRNGSSTAWTDICAINSTPGRANKNPVLCLTKEKKLLLIWVEEVRWHKWKRDILRIKRSDDLGRTWSAAEDLGDFRGFLTKNHPLVLPNGEIILPVYTDWSTSSAVISSKDGGLTWSKPSFLMYLFGTQPTIIERDDSSLFALMRTGMPPRLAWQAVSFDLGKAWSVRKLSSVKNPGASLEMVKLKNGKIVLAFNDSKDSRKKLSLALSEDGGRTWGPSKIIASSDQDSNCYPSIIQDRNGLIHVVYVHDGRRGIGHFVTDEKWITE